MGAHHATLLCAWGETVALSGRAARGSISSPQPMGAMGGAIMTDLEVLLADQAQTRLATAALFVALVRTLRSPGGDAQQVAASELERLFHRLRGQPGDDAAGASATLRWASELLRE